MQREDEPEGRRPAGQVDREGGDGDDGETDGGHGDPAHLLALLARGPDQADDDRRGAGHQPGEDAGVGRR